MNNQHGEFDELENALRQMPLRAPSPELDRRVEAAMQRRPEVQWVIGLAAATLAAAAAVLLAVKVFTAETVAPAPSRANPLIASTLPLARPVQIVQTDSEWTQDGIVGVETDGPVRQYRLITTHQITEVDNGKLATMTFPQEEVYQVVSEAF